MDLSALNEAAMNSMVSEQTSANTWEQMVLFVTSNKASYPDTKNAIKTVEQTYKAEHGKALGTAWRSAKSTLLKALRLGVSLLGNDGKPLGKTAVSQAAILATTPMATNEDDILHAAKHSACVLSNAVERCLTNGSTKEDIKAVVYPIVQSMMEKLDA